MSRSKVWKSTLETAVSANTGSLRILNISSAIYPILALVLEYRVTFTSSGMYLELTDTCFQWVKCFDASQAIFVLL
jgi:hypothetical protein